MELTVRESNRWYGVEYRPELSHDRLREAMLRGEGITSDFSVLMAPAPPLDQTLIKAWGNDEELLIGVALLDSVPWCSSTRDGELPDTVEILFDTRNDRLGWWQFYYTPPQGDETTGEVVTNSHQPYAESHSSAYPWVAAGAYEWRMEQLETAYGASRCRWLFAHFALRDIFQGGPICGFNVCRNRPYLDEFSSWNFCGGNGPLDAASYGRLYRFAAPIALSGVTAREETGQLLVEGAVSANYAGEALTFTLANPLGDKSVLTAPVSGHRFSFVLDGSSLLAGRHRLYARCSDRAVEPRYLAVDIPAREAARQFCMSVTYDPPMNARFVPYTPERLGAEMAIWSELGLRRIHWIENGEFPLFAKLFPAWGESIANCGGDILACAVQQAHAQGLEVVGEYKPFDMGINYAYLADAPESSLMQLEGRAAGVTPELMTAQQATMRTDPAWLSAFSFPVTSICLYSEEPIPPLTAADIVISTSADNADYRPLSGSVTVTQGTLERPHQRWTPAGPVEEEGTRTNWLLRIEGLRITDPYVAIQVAGTDLTLTQRGYMLAEARDSHGQLAPLTLATKGNTEQGLSFWKEWPGWANGNEPIVERRRWSLRCLGMALRVEENLSTLLEPAHPDAQAIWLGRIAQMARAGVDNISIRTLCHHNAVPAYLTYAFAPVVRETFASLYGRQPQMTPEDYTRIRCIRGEAYTDFLRQARKVAHAAGAKLSLQFESGMEAPPKYHTRMQMHWEWRKWIEEGLLDEIQLKWWTAESAFIHEEVLPLARRHQAPVQIISRNLAHGLGIRSRELLPEVARNAVAAGFAGFSLYEAVNVIMLNPEGCSQLKGNTEPAVRAAMAAVRQWAEGRVCSTR